MVFLTQYRLYEWVVMRMGLMNMPATLMQTMNNLFMDVLDKRVVVFLVNIIIYIQQQRYTLNFQRRSSHAYVSTCFTTK